MAMPDSPRKKPMTGMDSWKAGRVPPTPRIRNPIPIPTVANSVTRRTPRRASSGPMVNRAGMRPRPRLPNSVPNCSALMVKYSLMRVP